MLVKKILLAAAVVVTAIITGCFKDPLCDTGHFLKFSHAFVHVDNQKGSHVGVMIESDVSWELSLEAPAPSWVSLSKQAGSHTDSLIVTATENNNTGGYKFATVIASAPGNISVPPARLLIVQYDSTYNK